MDGWLYPTVNALRQLACSKAEGIAVRIDVGSDKTFLFLRHFVKQLATYITTSAAMQRPIAAESRFPSRSKQSRLLSQRIRFRFRMARTTYVRLAVSSRSNAAICPQRISTLLSPLITTIMIFGLCLKSHLPLRSPVQACAELVSPSVGLPFMRPE